MTCRKVTGEKVAVENEGVTVSHEKREVHATGGKMKGRKEMREDVTNMMSITGMMTGRKEAGEKRYTEDTAGEKSTTR